MVADDSPTVRPSRAGAPGVALIAASLAWLGLVAGGFGLLVSHAAAPGDPGAPAASWPVDAGLEFEPGRFNLVMFAHPRCPCTRASLAELARLMARAGGRASARVLFFVPEGRAGRWGETELWRSAAAIPGVRPAADPGGAEADRFGAATSGHVLLFGPEGALLFSGGITAMRGHEGDNAGRDAVVALLGGPGDGRGRTPVFGCSIAGDLRVPGGED